MQKIQIRKPTEVSWQEYKDLRLEALRTEPQAFGSSYEKQKNASDADWQTWLEKYRQADGNWMLFAKEHNNLVGMMGAYQTEDDRKNNIATVIGAYVTKAARGKGVATLLMKELIKHLQQRTDIQKVVLHVNPEQVSAVKLYEHAGFTLGKTEMMMLGDGIERETYILEKQIR